MDTPTYDSEGFQTWKPQPGEYYKLGLKQRESYGGIIASLKDALSVTSCGVSKAYPHNFAGIIAAIEDLADCINQGNNIDIGQYPPGWEINIDNNNIIIGGDWTELPKDGNLWFDTRQGRLFVAIDGKYWQTNGGDGLAYVDDGVPQEQPVIGSTWFDTYNKLMYVWTGQGSWEAVKGVEDAAQTTATLPLAFRNRLTAGGGNGARILPEDFPTAEDWPAVLPPLDLVEQNVQADYNEWLLWALFRVGEATEYNTINFGPNPPPEDQLQPGSMWYDTNALELSVWYSDGDSSQWVPTSVSYQYDEALARMQVEIDTEVEQRTAAVQQTESRLLIDIYDVKNSVTSLDGELRQRITDAINALVIPDPDLTSYSTNSNVDEVKAALEQKVNAARSELELKLLEVETSLNAVDTDVINTINTKATQQQLAAVSDAIPSISHLPTNEVVDSKISAITGSFLPRTGGTLSGAFVVEKVYMDKPAFDFSSAAWHGNLSHKYRTNSNEENYATFGTNDNPWEYAWDFSSDEEFCWVFNDSNKVFSITKEGPACSQLYITEFGETTENGRELRNKIDVKDRLITYQTAFEKMRQSVSVADDFDELKLALLTALASV